MRFRSLIMIIFFVLVGGFVTLNWMELSRNTVLNLGVTTVEGPLGLVMLGLLLLAVILFLGYAVMIQTSSLLETRAHTKEMKTQRELADKAEASRYTELRGLIDKIETESRDRQSQLQQWMDSRLNTLQDQVCSRVDTSGNTIASYMGELEDRLEAQGLPPNAPMDHRRVPADAVEIKREYPL